MTTTRYFEVKVTSCENCPRKIMQFGWLTSCLHESIISGDCFKKQSKLHEENKDAITPSCPMWNQTKESEQK